MTRLQIEEELQKITKQLIHSFKPEKIILFGSGARGDYGPDSDLDILVIKDGLEEVRFRDRCYQVRKLFESEMPVDFLVYTPYEIRKRLYLEDPFFIHIFSEGRILYGA